MNKFRSELEHLADHTDVTSTGVNFITDTARRRTRRRRVLVGGGGAAALIAVTAVGVQQLSQVGNVDTIETPTAEQPATPTTSVDPGAVAATTAPPAATQAAVGADMYQMPGAIPAQRGASNLAWRVVEADSPEALALRFNSDTSLALATEPATITDGIEGPPDYSLYRNVDGEWTKVADDVLPNGLRIADTSNDAVYAVGTAPATAGAPQGSAGVFSPDTGEWTLASLPADAAPLDTSFAKSYTEYGVAALDDGALISITNWYEADYSRIQELVPTMYEMFPTADGMTVLADCDANAMDEEMMASGNTVFSSGDFRKIASKHCTERTLSWDEFGATAADQQALQSTAQTSLWRFSNGEFAPVELPNPNANSVYLANGLLVTQTVTSDGDQQSGGVFVVNPDGSFTPVFSGLETRWLWGGKVDGDRVIGNVDRFILTDTLAGDAPLAVDLAPALTPAGADPALPVSIDINNVPVVAGHTIAVPVGVNWMPAGGITEPVVVENNGYRMTVDPVAGISFENIETGAPVYDYNLATEPNRITLRSSGNGEGGWPEYGTVPPTTAVAVPSTMPYPDGDYDTWLAENTEELASFEVDVASLPTWRHRYDRVIASSVDGVTFGVDDLREVFGVTDDSTQIEVQPMTTSSANGQVIVSARLVTNGDWGNAPTLLAIGTPIN